MTTTLDPTVLAYDLAVMSQSGELLHIPRAGLVLEEQEDQMSATLRFAVPNVTTTVGPMRKLVPPGAPVYCYVVERGPTGTGLMEDINSELAGGTPWDPYWVGLGFSGGASGRVEVFRGTIMERSEATDSIEIQITARDVLFTTLKHEVDAHIDAGTTFKDALTRLASEWGLSVGRVDGPDATLPEKTWRGETCGAIIADLLDMAMAEGGGVYIIRATGDDLEIVEPGRNEPVYLLGIGGGAGVTQGSVSIADLVGSVSIVAETEDKSKPKEKLPPQQQNGSAGKPPPAAVVKTLHSDARFNGASKRIYVDRTSMSGADLEAQLELARSGFPTWRFQHVTVDIPQVRKYDRIAIDDDLLHAVEPLYVLSVSHDAATGKMSLELQTQEDFVREGQAAMMEAQLEKLRGEEKEAATVAKEGSATDARQRVLDKCQHVFGTPYVWGGPGGRSYWGADKCESDCSGFVTWLCHQLGAPTGVYAFTDNMAGVSQLVATNSTAGGMVGDFVLQKDPSVQAGATYYHVQMLTTPSSGEVVEDGGSRSPSSIGLGHIFGNYEVRRFPPLYDLLHGSGATKKKEAKK